MLGEMAMLEEATIRERTYSLWEKDARPEGAAKFYWHLARQQLEAQMHPQAIGARSEFDFVKLAAYSTTMPPTLDRLEGTPFAKCEAD